MRSKKGIAGSFMTVVPSYMLVLLLMIFLLIAGVIFSAGKQSNVFSYGSDRAFYGSGVSQPILFKTFKFEDNIISVLEFSIKSTLAEKEITELRRTGLDGAQRDASLARIEGLYSFGNEGNNALKNALVEEQEKLYSDDRMCFLFLRTPANPVCLNPDLNYLNIGDFPKSYYWIIAEGEIEESNKCLNIEKYYEQKMFEHVVIESKLDSDTTDGEIHFYYYYGRCLQDE